MAGGDLAAAVPISRRLDAFAREAKEVSRSVNSQIPILRDLLRPFARPLGEISFGQGLQPPSNPPEQMLPMFAARLFLKGLLIFLTQFRHTRPAQAFDLSQNLAYSSKVVSSPWC